MKTPRLVLKIASIALLFVAVACANKDDYQIPPIYDISDEFKSYTVFDSASFWVYKNDSNTTIDTVKIIKVLTDKRFHIDNSGATGFYYNAIELMYNESTIGFMKAELTAGSKYDANTTMTENYRLYLDNGRYFSIFTPKFPIGSTQILGINEGNYTNVKIHDTFFVNEIEFSSVYETSVKDYHDGNDTVFMKFYIAKYGGLVKWTKSSTTIKESWSLKSSSLLQSQ
jgi:hypothetical protein